MAELFKIIKWPSIVDKLSTFWHIHTMKFYAVEKNEYDLHVLNAERSSRYLVE